MTNRRKSIIYALASVALWSTAATAFKIALKDFSPFELLLFSSIFSFMALIVISFFTGASLKIKFKSAAISAFLGFLNPFLYYLILFKAYDLLPAQEALALNYSWAVLVPLLAAPILKQKLTIISVIALLISFAGAALVALKGDIGSLSISNSLGATLALSSAVIWALYWVLNTKDKREPLAKLTYNFLFGSIYCIVFAMSSGAVEFKSFSSYLPLIYIGLFEMGITFYFWMKAMQLSSKSSEVSSLIFLSPFLSLFLINYALGERVVLNTIVGLLLIIIGIIMNNNADFLFSKTRWKFKRYPQSK